MTDSVPSLHPARDFYCMSSLLCLSPYFLSSLNCQSEKNKNKIPLKKLPISTILYQQWIRALHEGVYLSSQEHVISLFWLSLTALKPVSSHSRLEIARQVRIYLVCAFLLHACSRFVCSGPQEDKRPERRLLTSDKHKTKQAAVFITKVHRSIHPKMKLLATRQPDISLRSRCEPKDRSPQKIHSISHFTNDNLEKQQLQINAVTQRLLDERKQSCANMLG